VNQKLYFTASCRMRGSSAAAILPNWTLFRLTTGELFTPLTLIAGLNQLKRIEGLDACLGWRLRKEATDEVRV